ncbi:hypothetical protein ACFQE1_10475 [Halobium palmae]|uniref:Uncharacterized protein n=1 Tax=Halobium palmae TaxID=1776492 RepID=A0ABD5RZV3_9EURY
MPTGRRSDVDAGDEEPRESAVSTPAISASESSPGRTVFMEADNTDGWISSDHTVEPTE